jgi:hypothetical protein
MSSFLFSVSFEGHSVTSQLYSGTAPISMILSRVVRAYEQLKIQNLIAEICRHNSNVSSLEPDKYF